MASSQPMRVTTSTGPQDWASLAGLGVEVVGVPVLVEAGELTLPAGMPTELPAQARPSSGAPRPAAGDAMAAVVDLQLDERWAHRRRFRASVGETVERPTSAGPAIVYLGFGPVEAVATDAVRRAAAALVRAANPGSAAVLLLPADLAERAGAAAHGLRPSEEPIERTAEAVAEGASLAAYRFLVHKSHLEGEVLDTGGGHLVLAVPGADGAALAGGAQRGTRTAEAVWLARDLVNEPPSLLNPSRFAEVAAEVLTDRPGTTLEAWDEDRITAERLGGLLGVARGSSEAPVLLRATYDPPAPARAGGTVPHVVLVGKGITFDSGGLSLKTAGGMTTMKTDMSGAAAVLGALSACADLGVQVRVTGIMPLTENMPGGRAQKPGDVLTVRNGATIEVLNTDAEGRLVLADGLVLAAEARPDAIIDLATLTGACVVALGTKVAGVFSNDEVLAARVAEASKAAGEQTWPLPLVADYQDHIESDVADMKNVGKDGQAGAIAAALLLSRFVGDVPWAHLDIAGPARSDEDAGLVSKGGTGFGVRTLLQLLRHWS